MATLKAALLSPNSPEYSLKPQEGRFESDQECGSPKSDNGPMLGSDCPHLACFRTTISAAGAVMCASFSTVYMKKIGYHFSDNPSTILCIVSGMFVLILSSFLTICEADFPPKYLEKDVWRNHRGFMFTGFLNAVNGIMTVYTNPVVSGYLQTMLTNLSIPITVFLTSLLIGKEYVWLQFLALGMIVLGTSLASGEAYTKAAGIPNLTAVIVFGLAQAPACLSQIFQQMKFTQLEVSPLRLLTWASIGQFFTLIALTPLIDLYLGWTPFYTSIAGIGWVEASKLTVMSLSLLVSSFFAMQLLRYTSATTSCVIMSLVTPVTLVLLSTTLIMGVNSEGFHTGMLGNTILVILGNVLYRISAKEATPDGRVGCIAVSAATMTQENLPHVTPSGQRTGKLLKGILSDLRTSGAGVQSNL